MCFGHILYGSACGLENPVFEGGVIDFPVLKIKTWFLPKNLFFLTKRVPMVYIYILCILQTIWIQFGYGIHVFDI